jgi:hypothetical protein
LLSPGPGQKPADDPADYDSSDDIHNCFQHTAFTLPFEPSRQ